MSIPRLIKTGIYASAVVWSFAWGANAAFAQGFNDLPSELEGVEVIEKLGEQIPLQLEFKNERDQTVKLEQYFDGERPVILALIYFRCPMLCGLVLNGLIDGLRGLNMTPGDEFQTLIVSIDPLETPRLAQMTKQNLIQELGKPSAASGIHLLTGREANIRILADSVGFGYKWNDRTNEYMHKAVIFVLMPDGRISRYLYDIIFEPQTLRLALVEASEGKVGSTVDRVLWALDCFVYDPSSNSYVLAAMGLMRIGGGLTVLIGGAALASLWLNEYRKRRAAAHVEETYS